MQTPFYAHNKSDFYPAVTSSHCFINSHQAHLVVPDEGRSFPGSQEQSGIKIASSRHSRGELWNKQLWAPELTEKDWLKQLNHSRLSSQAFILAVMSSEIKQKVVCVCVHRYINKCACTWKSNASRNILGNNFPVKDRWKSFGSLTHRGLMNNLSLY